jgi:hypothetical protein
VCRHGVWCLWVHLCPSTAFVGQRRGGCSCRSWAGAPCWSPRHAALGTSHRYGVTVKPDPEVGKWSPHRTGPLSPTPPGPAISGRTRPPTPTSPTLVTGPPGGADAAFDPVGGDYWLRSLKALTGGGILVAYGFFGMVNEPDVSLGLADRWLRRRTGAPKRHYRRPRSRRLPARDTQERDLSRLNRGS